MRQLLFAAVALSLSGPVLAADAAQLFAAKCQACHGRSRRSRSS